MLQKAALENGACGDQLSKSTPNRPPGKKWRRGQASRGRQVLHKKNGGGEKYLPVSPVNPRVWGMMPHKSSQMVEYEPENGFRLSKLLLL